jgi:peptidoglycan hydrolase-like protein with peptidoglycan-binding domain
MKDEKIKEIVSETAPIIFANEGCYCSVNANDNGALSVGKVQWHGNRALALLKSIIQIIGQSSATDFLGDRLYKEILNTTNWANRKVNATERTALSELLDTQQSRSAQDALAQTDIMSYVTHGVNLGIEDPQSLVYYADLENQGGAGASKRIGLAAVKTAGSAAKVTLEIIHKEALSDRVMGKYASRRNKVFERAKELFIDTVSKEGESMTENELRNLIVQTAKNYLGVKESDGSHRQIIDLYNAYKPLARGYKVKYSDSWCATFVSVIAIITKMTSIIPTECGCGQMIELFKKLGEWQENDGYIPKPADIIFYDWDDNGKGDTSGWPEHVGIVGSLPGDIEVVEGNLNNAVGCRRISINGKFIRGYGVPNYAALANQMSSASDGGTVKLPEKKVNPYQEPTALLKYVKSDVPKVREVVKWLQWELNEHGYPIAIDGKFGTKTDTALESFQKSAKLKVDGICGPLTRKALKANK